MVKSLASIVLAGLLYLPPIAEAVTLNGRVVDSQSQRSYDDARINTGLDSTTVSSDPQGFFRLDNVRPGPLLLSVMLKDGSHFRVRLQVPAQPALFVELDRARHVAPREEDEY
jgi:hypothetical protein